MTIILTGVAIVFVLLLAAWLNDQLDASRSERSALQSALERGEIGEEAYARGLQSLERSA